MATHPANAVFVSGDGKVSFNENGRKLDSNGNVVWGDYQGLRGANARVRPEIVEAYRKEEEAQRQQQQAPPVVQEYRPPGGQGTQQGTQQPTNQWAGVGAWDAPMQAQPWRQYRPQQPAWEPPPSGLGTPQQTPYWNQFTPPQQWEPPPSGLGAPQQAQGMVDPWNRYKPPRSYNPYTP
jgi:hypothetical protein